MRLALMLVLAAVFALPANAQRGIQTGFLDRSIKVGGESYRYQVYVPAEYASTSRWPVIVSLHGGGRGGTDGMQPTATDFAIHIRGDRAAFPSIVLFPQARADKRFMYPEMEELVMAELRQTRAEFRVDSARIYLHGNSMGATGAYRIAYRWPKTFAALVAVSGQVQVQDPYPQAEIDLDHRTNPFTNAPDPFAALAAGIKHMPIWIFHGDSDEVIPVEQSRQLLVALKRAGANVRYTEYPGSTHNETPKKAYAEPELLPWIFSQHR